MTAYYNEIEPYAAEWLRNLIAAGHLPAGDVDERSIVDVEPSELKGYTQCHFFAGIGGWPYAMRLARWPDDQPVWTGSCPCQPFSSAGQRKGFEDDRHLWPTFHRLIAECAPPVVFGEQVASKAGLAWLDLVHADLEASGYAVGAADMCAAGVGAPHIRQRLWWVADTLRFGQSRQGQVGRSGDPEADGNRQVDRIVNDGPRSGLADAGLPQRQANGVSGGVDAKHVAVGDDSPPDGVADTCGAGRPSAPDNQWRDADWLFCRDGKWRPVKSGTFPLAHGVSGRVGRLRAYGNAIVPQVAAEFVAAYLEASA